MPLKNWSIQYRGSASQKFYKKNFEGNAEIPAYGFYLIARNGYAGTHPSDMSHSAFSLSSDGGTIFLSRSKTELQTGLEDAISDKVAYLKGAATSSAQIFPETKEINIENLAAGGSFERKSNASSTAETMTQGGINEFDGNAHDTDNNFEYFVLRASPLPQSASSTPEDPTSQHYPAPAAPLMPEPSPPTPPPEPEPIVACAAPTYENHDNTGGSVDRGSVQDFPYPIFKNTTKTLTENTTYYVDDLDSAYVPAGAKLIIEEGVVIKFGRWRRANGSSPHMPLSLRVQGSLEINGTKSNPVIFTSFRDDEHGMKIETSTSTPSPGDWGAIQIESNNSETIKISGATVYYGGGSGDGGNAANGAIFINQSSADVEISDTAVYRSMSGAYMRPLALSQPKILNSIFEHNSLWGIFVEKNNAAKIVGNTFSCNGLSRASGTTGGVNLEGNVSSVMVENNNFLGNQNIGLNYYTEKKTELNAANNYWGSSTGPYHATKNPQGKGDSVSDNINFTSWSNTKF